MKLTKYKVVYPVAGAVPFIVAAAFFLFYGEAGLFYSVCFGVLAGATGLVIARMVMQCLIDGNNDPKTWQINIYAMVAVCGWIGAILAETWGWTSFFLCMVACGLLLCFGTRFLKDEDGNGIPDIFERKKVTPQYLYDHMLFELKEDRLGNAADQMRPICLIGGKAYTVSEALEAGHTEAAEHGIEYIDGLFKAEEGKNA